MSEQETNQLREVIKDVMAKIRKFQDRNLGEQNTKATLIDPVLEALGWDVRDPDEVYREYKPTSRDSPVDYALTILRKPRLFVEAKGLGETLADRKWIAQVLGYATVAGVEWCVLTDGDEYRFYNATAAVDAEEKLFCRVRLTDDPIGEVATTLLSSHGATWKKTSLMFSGVPISSIAESSRLFKVCSHPPIGDSSGSSARESLNSVRRISWNPCAGSTSGSSL